jgi:hypothetical protein
MQKKSLANSPSITELRHKKYKALKAKIIFYGILFIIFLIGICLILRISKININEVKISGNRVVDSKSIEDTVRENLRGNYFFLFPKTNFIIYPKEKIIKDLSSKYKRLKTISLNVVDFKTLEVLVNEYNGKYLWCGGVVKELDSRIEQKCYFMDSAGYIFDEAPFFSGEVFLKFYGLIPNIEKQNPLGNYFNSEIFSKLIRFKELLEQNDFKVLSIWVNDQNEVYFNLSTLGIALINPKIILNTDFDYDKIAENLEAAIATEPLKTELKNNYASFSYLDLRFGNKVHFKFNE